MTDTLKLGDLSNEDVAKSLNLILEDIAAYPERLKPLNAALAQRALALVNGVEIDLNAPLSALDE